MRSRLIQHLAILFFALACVIACSNDAGKTLPQQSYVLDTSRITVSGNSAGGYMAGQLHLSHSDLFSGVAILAGGPYYCAEGSLRTGLGACLTGDEIDVKRLLDYAREMSDAGKIDALTNLSDDTVWLFHGAKDTAVGKGVVTAAAAFYAQLVTTDRIVTVTDVPVVHGLPTLSTGASCDEMATPFLNACGYDAAGELLTALHGSMQPRVAAGGELRVIPQSDADDADMLDSAFLYVPKSCAEGASCGLHVALHGCQQSSEFIGDAFAAGAGYNEWAESNKLLVLYPQVASSKLVPLNPLGCWDWWGYTNEHYATRAGPQVAAIKIMIDSLAKKK